MRPEQEPEHETDLLSFLEDLAGRWADDMLELAAVAREARREASAKHNRLQAHLRRRRRRDRS